MPLFNPPPTALPPSGAAGGDLSGTYPNPAVAQIDGQALPLPLTLGGTGQDAASAAALLTALGAAALAGAAFAGEVTVQAPVNASDAVTKAYADAIASGLSIKPSVQEATAAALPSNVYSNGSSGVGATLTGVATGVLTVDGVTVALNDRVLVKNEAAPANNGIYKCTLAGAIGVAYVLTRAADMNTAAQVPGAFVFTEQGTANAGAGFTVASEGPYTIGTTAITWTQFSGAGEITAGTGLSKSGNTIALSTPVSAANGGTGSAGRNFAGLLTPTAVQTSAYNATAGDYVPVDTTSGAVTITLPTAPADLTVIGIKMVTQGSTNTVTYACGGSDVFNKTGGATSGTLTLLSQGVLLQYKAAGAIWYVFADDLALNQLDLRYLKLSGGTMSGAIAMGANKITGLANGSGAQDAAAFGQVAALQDPLSLGIAQTFVPSGSSSANAVTANTGWYMRLLSGGYAFSHIAVGVQTSSGNICVAAYQTSGTGASAIPAAQLQTSGSVACPASGVTAVALGGSCTPNITDWLAIGCDNASATVYGANSGSANAISAGGTYQQTGLTGAVLPSPAGSPVANNARNFYLRGS